MAKVDLLGTTDAMVWAKEFVRIVRENEINPLDEGFMVGWFANAMAAQEMAGNLPSDECLTLRWDCQGCGRSWEVEMPGYPGTTMGGFHWHTLPGDPSGEHTRCEGPMVARVELEPHDPRRSTDD